MEKTTHNIYLDVETAPLPDDVLDKLVPEFEAPGNIKDPDKIKAALAEKRRKWKDDAALRATTGKVVAVTIAVDDDPPVMRADAEACGGDMVKEITLFSGEKHLLQDAVNFLRQHTGGGSRIWTWNGHAFDLPFICQRAAVHGVPAFVALMQPLKGGRTYWDSAFCDAMQVYTAATQRAEGFSLDAVSRSLGTGEKTASGKDFATTLTTDPAKALAYAVNDIELLRAVVKRMGFA